MKEEQIYNLLAKHFSGETVPAEEKIINDWLQEDPLNKDRYDEMKNLWDKTNPDITDWNVDSAWKNVASKTNIDRKLSSASQKSKMITESRFYFARVAAVLLVLIGGYFLLKQYGMINFFGNSNIEWIESVTAAGEKAEIILSDNSKIILNGSSRLKYPKQFSNDSREVFLEGEAYFEVVHKGNAPFIVHSGNISTTVLGTKFNVSAFTNGKNISVSLIEGKVKISKKELNEIQSIIILKPSQQLIYNSDAKISSVEQFDTDEAIGWKDGILKFDNEPLSDVLIRLERNYGTKFELAADSFKEFKVTANFKNESCLTITEVLQKLTGLEVSTKKENNVIKEIVFEEK